MDHNHWMQLALEQARLAEVSGEVPVGAVVVKDDQLIATGYNQPIESHDPSAHAEIIALRAAGEILDNYRLPECRLYVTIEPCVMCAGALVYARIKHLIYGANDLKAGACGSVISIINHEKLNHTMEVTSGVMKMNCQKVIQDFFRKKR